MVNVCFFCECIDDDCCDDLGWLVEYGIVDSDDKWDIEWFWFNVCMMFEIVEGKFCWDVYCFKSKVYKVYDCDKVVCIFLIFSKRGVDDDE